MEIAGLAKLIDAYFGSGAGNNDLEFGVAHGKIQHILRGTKV